MSVAVSENALFHAALEFQEYCQSKKWDFCFIGGLAVLRWGELRMTQDVDLSLLCGFGSEEKYIDPLLNDFNARISNAREFGFQNRVVLLYASNGVALDITLSGLPFEERMMKRASFFEYETGFSLLTCSVEDLIVLKAFAARYKDWMDVESILLRHSNLDKDYIFEQLGPLAAAKESPQIISKLQDLF